MKLKGLEAKLTKEAELVAAAVTTKESVFSWCMMKELGSAKLFDGVPVCIDNTSALHGFGNRTLAHE